VPLPRTDAETVSAESLDFLVAAYRPPDTVLTDNGPQFKAMLFQGVCLFLGVKNRYSTACHPQTNGHVERYNRTSVGQLRTFVVDHQDQWDTLVPMLALACNSRPQQSTGVAPLEFVAPERVKSLSVSRMVASPVGGPSTDNPRAASEKFRARLRNCGGWGPPWLDGPGVAYVGLRIGSAGGRTAFVGPTLAAPPGRIAEMMAPRDWPADAWTSCPPMVAVVGLDFSFACISYCLEGLAYRLVGRLHWPAPIGGRSTGSRGSFASTYFRGLGPNSGLPAKAPHLPSRGRGCWRVLARCGPARGPPWGLLRGGLGRPLVSKEKTNRALGLLLPRVCAVIPLSLSSGRAWTALFPCRFILGVPH